MILNCSLNDPTQKMILSHLKGTERLLEMASGSDVRITVMADACPAHNVYRMLDGHFTGTVTELCNLTKPFIPIGTTVNVCGVTMYKLKYPISSDDFKTRVYSAIENSPKPYTWNNFNRGNHFVSLMYSNGNKNSYLPEGQYLVVHASANEKRAMLYPSKDVWYANEVKTVTLEDDPKRSMHYITNTAAEKFYKIAEELLPFNEKRNSAFCETVLKEVADNEILSIQHYGMPNPNTICIGVQWQTDRIVPLLTAPGKDIYLVKPNKETKYFPHGFGLEIHDGDICYTNDGNIRIGTKLLNTSTSLSIGVDAFNRADRLPVEKCVDNILNKHPAEIVAKLKQIASISARGFEVFI